MVGAVNAGVPFQSITALSDVQHSLKIKKAWKKGGKDEPEKNKAYGRRGNLIRRKRKQ
jgi:hypothetical protein